MEASTNRSHPMPAEPLPGLPVTDLVAAGARGLAIVEGVIAQCERARTAGDEELKRAVACFRKAMAAQAPSDVLLFLSWEVHATLRALRNVETALRQLQAERAKMIASG